MLEIKNFTKKYGNNIVYEDFDISFADGEITFILGESGCGKTTLLNAVAGLTDYGGSITPVSCSYVFQEPRLVPNLTVFDNLRLVCSDIDAITDMLVRVKLSDKAGAYPRALSGGQAQRASLARAFLYKSDAVLMDEPFSSLDLKLKYEIIELFYEVWQQDGRTVLFVTHNADEAAKLARRVVIINGGRTVFDKAYPSFGMRTGEEADRLRAELLAELLK